MNLFRNMFGAEDRPDASNVDWKLLTNVSQLDDIIAQSSLNPVLIFKHSTRCGISRMTLKRFENEFNLSARVTPYFLDLLQYREISDAVAQRLGVVHQSPQLLLIKDGKSIYNASHEAISANILSAKF